MARTVVRVGQKRRIGVRQHAGLTRICIGVKRSPLGLTMPNFIQLPNRAVVAMSCHCGSPREISNSAFRDIRSMRDLPLNLILALTLTLA